MKVFLQLNRICLLKSTAYSRIDIIRMNSKVSTTKTLLSDIIDKEDRKKFRSKLSSKEKDYFDDSFYHEQLSRLNMIKHIDNVSDDYMNEPIVEENGDVLQKHSITREELSILANYIYIDDNGNIRIDKDKLDESNEENNVDIILKFLCVYLANFVPDKDDYERSLMNLILSSSTAKDIDRNLKDEINWKKVQELLHKKVEGKFDSNEVKKNNEEIKAAIDEDIKISSKASSELFNDFKRRCQFPIIYAGGMMAKNHVCVGLVFPEYEDNDEHFTLPYPNVDLIHCYLFSFNEAIKRALHNNWESVQISSNSETALKVVYDVVTLDRREFYKKYPKFSGHFQEFLDEFCENSLKLNINWALYNKSCVFGQKLHSKLCELRS